MWVPRDLKSKHKDFTTDPEAFQTYFGSNGITNRLGRASRLRRMSQKTYASMKRERRGAPVGPYLPVILEACGESQLAFEYRHGAESYGAFTFSLAEILRREKQIAFRPLVTKVAERLQGLGYDQTPSILGPSKVLRARVPWSHHG